MNKPPTLHDQLKAELAAAVEEGPLTDPWERLPHRQSPVFTMLEYSRQFPDRGWYVNFQRDKYWQKSGGRFTVNLMVSIPGLEELVRFGLPPLDRGGVHPWVASARLPMIDGGRDVWWQVGRRTRLPKLAAEVTETLTRHGMPWFEEHGDVAGLAGWFEREQNFWLAALARAAAGDLERGRIDLQRHLSHPPLPAPHLHESMFDRALNAGLVDSRFVEEAKTVLAKGRNLMDAAEELFGGLQARNR